MRKAILISCFGWYERRLKPIKDLLQSEYECIIITNDFSHSRKEYISTKIADCTYIHGISYKKNLSIGRILSHYDFSLKVSKILNREKPDLIYALLPPNSIGKICAKYKKKHTGCELIFDIIDMWPESMPLDKYKNTLPCKVWRNMRDKSLGMADYVLTECDLYISELNHFFPSQYRTLHLMKEQKKEEAKLVNMMISKIEPMNSRKTIFIGYVGNINNIINIDVISDIVTALTKSFDVIVKIIGDGSSREELVNRIKTTGAKVEFYGRVYDELKKIEILAGCDIALNIMKESAKVGLTIKSIDYFSYGLPIINNSNFPHQ